MKLKSRGLWLGCLVVSTVITVGAAIATAADSWVRVYTNQQQNRVFFVDRNSIKRQGSIRYFWLHIASANGQALGSYQNGNFHGVNIYASADCKSMHLRFRTVEFYDQNGKLLAQENAGDSGPLLSFARDNPAGRGVSQYVCKPRR
ncbi:MAG TPA: hypothetical protein IGS53_24575 [Leptolyngbyaceae cyanobacterium M33_DOE_097]|uniref:Surface-adhesin protein E-like domain-containing protein n=1 Tax=Oscillatoriales cyanobacterium SpSt-418 TaxID=2282169 RepID=A0A7C3KF72_9CYAN|nr:hypothetical protein [Leptolyngbyaceae cyanobacterium M33_DOE_097]